jgi:TonB family protein
MFCLDEGILRAHQDGELTEYEVLSVDRHLNLCVDCRQRSGQMSVRSQAFGALFAELSPLSHELRTDAFAANCALTRFKATYDVDLSYSFAAAPHELKLLLPDENLWQRFNRELIYHWQAFRHDPAGYVADLLRGEPVNFARRRTLRKGTAMVLASYVLAFATLIIAGGLRVSTKEIPQTLKSYELTRLMLPTPKATLPNNPPDYALTGKGGVTGGDKLNADPTIGGGGGGRNEMKPNRGKAPQSLPQPQIILPNPKSVYTTELLSIPETTIGAQRNSNGQVGLPDNADVPPASGSGKNAGIGENQGTGVGLGTGAGFGSGTENNSGSGNEAKGGGLKNNANSGRESETELIGEIFEATGGLGPTILYRGRASYTEKARENHTEGTVVLSVVFGADNRLHNIRTIQGLPNGLTENSIEALRKIKFRPAMRKSVAVSVRMEITFNFKVY